MTAFTEKLDRAAGAALCEGLTEAGRGLLGAGAVSIVFGGAGVVPIAFGTAALMASAAGCNWDSDAGDPAEPWPGDICYEGGSLFQINQLQNGQFVGGSTPELRKITSTRYEGTTACGTGGSRETWTIIGENASGGATSTALFLGGPCGGTTYTWDQVWTGDSTCNVPGPPAPEPIIPPYEYTDPVDGCSLTVNTKGWATDDNGSLNPVFKIEPGAELRAGGGVIGGCNFSPVIYTGNPGGPGEPPIIRPWDPDWDIPSPGIPPWANFLREVAAGVAANTVLGAIDALFGVPEPPSTWELRSVCEVDAEGNPQVEIVEAEIPPLKSFQSVNKRIDALIPFLQALKDFKQPVCPPAKAEGDLRTISFRSEEVSPNGKSCLRKRLRYRSLSGIGLNALIDYWKDFSFQAGPVIVKHIGSTLGSLTVWAASIDEGKRVILHAAGEAGVDANQAGRWEISGSTSTRRGMPGTMNIDMTGGYYWITARDGSDNRPIVGKT